MLFGMIGFEIRYQLRNPVFWVAIAIFFLIGFGITASENVSVGVAPGAVHENAPIAIAMATTLLSLFYLFVITAFVANAIVRDDTTGFAPIVRATAVTRTQIVLGRFIGGLAVAELGYLMLPLGMAFGVLSNVLLISLGVSPAAASAGVHTVETFTTCASGVSHIAHRNVDWKLLARLALPGIIGAAIGAYLLSPIDAAITKPLVLAYLSAIGAFLVWRGVRYPPHHTPPRIVAPLGFAGGFLDAAGGGGWGPVVTGNLLVQGAEPRKTIGTVNTSEFLIALTSAITFIATLGLAAFTAATIGLLIGGIIAAPAGG